MQTKHPTRPTQQYWFAAFPIRVKNADKYKKILLEKFFQQCQDNFLTLLKQKNIDVFYEQFRTVRISVISHNIKE